MEYVTPLFVCGMGRSGTTNALHVLNAHPAVLLSGEVSLAVLKQFLGLLDTLERSYNTREATLDGWFARKGDYMLESFGYLAKGGRGKLHKRINAQYMGHKTPRLETLFDEYEKHFAAAQMTPRWFYCVRNPFDCWRSYKATSWSSYENVGQFLAQYLQSLEKLRAMQEAAAGRVFVLDLDALKAVQDKLAFYRARMFEPLGLAMPERMQRRLGNISAQKEAAAGPAALSGDDRRQIEDHPASVSWKNATASA
jgi:hypothetical protein